MTDKLDSNTSSMAIADESTLGVLPVTPVWYAMEPNSYQDLGGDSPTKARSPINAGRQRQKGAVVGLNAGAGFNHDFLMTALNRALRSFFFAVFHEKADTKPYDGTSVAVASVSGVAATIAAGPTFLPTALVLGIGFGIAANNAVHALSAATGTVLTGSGFSAEAAPPAAARLVTVGYRGAAADITMTVTAGVPTLGSTALDFTTLGLSAGEWVYLGDDTVGNRFATCPAGFARIKTVAAHAIVFDFATADFVTDAGTGKTISIYCGKFLRNETTSTLIVQKSVQIERQLGNYSETGANQQAEYVVGCVGSEFKLNMPMEDLLTCDLTFVGIDTDENTSATGPKTGTRVAVTNEDGINTSQDLAFNRLYLLSAASGDMTPSGLFGYVESGDIAINNQLEVNKALGRLGGFAISAGDFVGSGSVSPYFTNIAAVASVRSNAACGWCLGFATDNAGFVWDFPACTLSGGRVSVEKDKPMKMPLGIEAFESDTYGFTLGYTNFPYLPTQAMPT